jgi:hypothetical protein
LAITIGSSAVVALAILVRIRRPLLRPTRARLPTRALGHSRPEISVARRDRVVSWRAAEYDVPLDVRCDRTGRDGTDPTRGAAPDCDRPGAALVDD